MEEADSKVQEKPATERSKAQRMIIITVGLVAIIFVVALFSQIDRESSNKEVESKKTGLEEGPNDVETDAKKRFDDRVALREKRLAEDPDMFSDLNQAYPGTNSQRSDIAGRTQSGAATEKKKTPEEIFKEEERYRSLRSRASKFNVKLQEGATKTLSSPVAPGSASEQAKEISTRLAEAKKLREDLTAGRISPQAVAERLGGAPVQTIRAAGPSPRSVSSPSQPFPVVGFTNTNADNNAEDIEGKLLVTTGTIINAVLDQTVVSDYPGGFKGRITHDVYDPTHDYVLIPKGAKVVGRSMTIGNVNEPIQARMGLAIDWVIMPDGSRIDLSKSSALDRAGIGAIKDKVNRHFVAQFLGVGAYALLISQADGDSSSNFTGETDIEGDVEEELRKQFAPLAAKYLNLVPTVTLRSGQGFKVFVEDDLWVQPWSSVYENLITRH